MGKLNVPHVESVRYERNFIKTCVCELRFPFLLELETKQPTKLQKSLRKEYPIYEAQSTLEVGSAPDLKKENRYVFRTKGEDWSVALRAFSVALETTNYKDFGDFTKRLQFMIEKCLPLLDTDFYTRVGLRYINAIPLEDGEIEGWVNSSIHQPLVEGAYGDVSRYLTEVRGKTECGQYTFRHGIDPEVKDNVRRYMLDYDYYMENVSINDALDLVSKFNEINFSFFSWSIGPKGIQWLGKGVTKS